MNLPGRGRVSILSYIVNYTENSWVSESENLKKLSNSTYIITCCLGGFKKNDSSISKNKLQQIQLSDSIRTSNGTGFYGQMKQKNI